MLIVFCRAVILYVVVIASFRFMGKRQLGELQPSELAVTLMLSNIATLPVEDINLPMTMGLVPVLALVCLDVFASHLCLKFRKLRKIIGGSPKIIISGGKIHKQTMKDLRLTADDLAASLRSADVFDINDVQLAVVETTGKISVFQKQSVQPLTPDFLRISAEDTDPPLIVIDDGEIAEDSLRFIGFDKKWINDILSGKNLTVEQVFIMTADSTGKYTIIKKEDLQ